MRFFSLKGSSSSDQAPTNSAEEPHFKEDSVIADSEAVFGPEVREPLHVARQVVPKRLDLLDDPLGHRPGDGLDVLGLNSIS